MLGIALLIAQIIAPPPEPARTVDPRIATEVDFFLINQFRNEWCGVTRIYVSYWTVHYFPTASYCKVPIYENRGWSIEPVQRCSDGFSVTKNNRTVTANVVLFLMTDYDFEYRNRDVKLLRRIHR